jgi:hypothetical protein
VAKRGLRFLKIPVAPQLDDAVEEAVLKGFYATKADLIREAVRLRLEELGLLRGPSTNLGGAEAR